MIRQVYASGKVFDSLPTTALPPHFIGKLFLEFLTKLRKSMHIFLKLKSVLGALMLIRK